MATVSAAQTFTSLFSFDDTDGKNPLGALVQGANGNFYGITTRGGANAGGTVFEITPAGALTSLYDFYFPANGTDGDSPNPVIQAPNGNLYGTTFSGGANQYGTVFEITPAGTLTTLYSFCSQADCSDGEYPVGPLVQATNGNFYGTTESGGANASGTVFEVTPAGKLTTLYSFCSQPDCADGALSTGGLVQATNGNFYGTTINGGVDNPYGTVFEITPAGKLTTLHEFCSQTNCADGATPGAGLVQATNGNFYGTTLYGGANGSCAGGGGCGTVFEITPAGKLTTLYSFCSQSNCTDGEYPGTALVQATDGNFYGTAGGGANNYGTIFEITSTGTLTTLYSPGYTDRGPQALVQATDGTFYGTTATGGTGGGYGTVFSLSVGLGPFVETIPTAGKVGAKVSILGYKLTGAAKVTFNGTPAAFTVNSTGTEIATTVPAGATTGTVQVLTRGGPLSSNVPFRVVE